MDITGQVVLAYLEEDDSKRVLFRVRPLLTAFGTLTSEDLESFQQDGYLRIAPDKQEQHTFKERMRKMGSLCLINLSGSAQALGKIRPNKNFAPQRGEINQYIVYSDAVQPLPEGLIYEVVSGDKEINPLTGQYYLRSGGRISGPHCAAVKPGCPASHSLPPDCDRLFLVEMPDNSNRMFYWPDPPQEMVKEASEPKDDPSAQPDKPQITNKPPPPPGVFQAAAAQVLKALEDAGFIMSESRVVQLLLLCLLSKRAQINADCLADAQMAATTIASLFTEGSVAVQSAGEGEVETQTSLYYAEGHGIAQSDQAFFLKAPWPVFRLRSGDNWPGPGAKGTRLSKEALLQELNKLSQSISEETQTRLTNLQQALEMKGLVLPLVIRHAVVEWIMKGAAATLGGQEQAIKDALDCWVKPWLLSCGLSGSELERIPEL